MNEKREKLIQIIEQAQREAKDTAGSMNGGFASWYADKLLEAGVTPVQGWIPVTERLPDSNEVVLAYLPDTRGTQARIQTQMGWRVAKFCSHWMPLPDAPEDVENV